MYPALLVSWPKTRDIHLLFSMARWTVQWVSRLLPVPWVSRNILVVPNIMRTRITMAMRILTGLGLFGMKNSCSSIVTGCRKWKSLLSHLCLRPPLMVLLICLNVIKANFLREMILYLKRWLILIMPFSDFLKRPKSSLGLKIRCL